MIIQKTYAQTSLRLPINLGLSENPLGCSPRVLETLENITLEDISQYPNTTLLFNALAKDFSISPQNILLGTGSEQLIKLITQTFLKKNDLVLIQRGSFSLFTKESQLLGTKIKFIAPSQIVTKPNTQLIFLCSPNNPTGEIINKNILLKIVKTNPRSIIVIDEAIGEFLDSSFVPQAIKTKNCIVLKTFSKAFGLAGIRVGFAIGATSLISQLELTQQPFPISSISCKLALAALEDKNFIARTKAFIKKERQFILRELKELNLQFSNSATNNIFIEFPKAEKLIKELNKRGVSVIGGVEFPGIMRKGFRISIKDRKTNKLFIQKLDEALACMQIKKLIPSRKSL